MAILIDGYNLLHAAGIIPRGIGAGTLERARQALLNWLVGALQPDQLADTTVVFDAAHPPSDLPRHVDHRGLTVLYSTGYENADAMLEELIRKAAVPKRLVVVSSDHRVQRAARRRRSIAVDSDKWYFELREQRNRPALESPLPTKPVAPPSADEVQHWLDEFSDLIDDLDQLESAPAENPAPRRAPADEQLGQPSPSSPGDSGGDPSSAASSPAKETLDADLANPFPPGYGEDLLEPDADLDE